MPLSFMRRATAAIAALNRSSDQNNNNNSNDILSDSDSESCYSEIASSSDDNDDVKVKDAARRTKHLQTDQARLSVQQVEDYAKQALVCIGHDTNANPLLILSLGILPNLDKLPFELLFTSLVSILHPHLPAYSLIIVPPARPRPISSQTTNSTKTNTKEKTIIPFLIKSYTRLDKVYRKGVQKLYILNTDPPTSTFSSTSTTPTSTTGTTPLRAIAQLFSTLVSRKAGHKIHWLSSWHDLCILLQPPSPTSSTNNIDYTCIPPSVRDQIYNPIFGMDINLASSLPRSITRMLRYLAASPAVLTPGLFRLSPRLDDLRHVRRVCQATVPSMQEVQQWRGVLVAAVLKEWLKELSGCVIARDMFSTLDGVELDRQEQGRRVVEYLSPGQFLVLKPLIETLHCISRHAEHNGMTSTALAICVAPCLLRSDDTLADLKACDVGRDGVIGVFVRDLIDDGGKTWFSRGSEKSGKESRQETGDGQERDPDVVADVDVDELAVPSLPPRPALGLSVDILVSEKVEIIPPATQTAANINNIEKPSRLGSKTATLYQTDTTPPELSRSMHSETDQDAPAIETTSTISKPTPVPTIKRHPSDPTATRVSPPRRTLHRKKSTVRELALHFENKQQQQGSTSLMLPPPMPINATSMVRSLSEGDKTASDAMTARKPVVIVKDHRGVR